MKPRGKLIAIGGNEDKGIVRRPTARQKIAQQLPELQILRRTLAELPAGKAGLELVTTASRFPEETGEIYRRAFGIIGFRHLGVMHLGSREGAAEPHVLERIRNAGGVLFSGGDQSRIIKLLGGTPFMEIAARRYREEGFVIAGTSAGAMAMSQTMIAGGGSAEALLKGKVKLTGGLGLIDELIIDSHFVERGRIGRIMQAVAYSPDRIGIGLGEDTGVVISGGRMLEAIGSGLVIIADGREIRYSNVQEIPEGAPLSIEHLVVHVLARGNHYDVVERAFHRELDVPSHAV